MVRIFVVFAVVVVVLVVVEEIDEGEKRGLSSCGDDKSNGDHGLFTVDCELCEN
jgi:hypothetical protein